jgi:hypothetical protein
VRTRPGGKAQHQWAPPPHDTQTQRTAGVEGSSEARRSGGATMGTRWPPLRLRRQRYELARRDGARPQLAGGDSHGARRGEAPARHSCLLVRLFRPCTISSSVISRAQHSHSTIVSLNRACKRMSTTLFCTVVCFALYTTLFTERSLK